jgi:hypothetical protein
MKKPEPADFPGDWSAYLKAFNAYHVEHDKLNKALAKELSKSLTRDRNPLRRAVERDTRTVRKFSKELAALKAASHFDAVRTAALAQLLKSATSRAQDSIEALTRFDQEIGRAPPAPKAPPPSPAYGIPPERKAQLRAQYPHIKFYDEYNT